MKLNKLFSWMAVSTLVLTGASCQDNAPVQNEPNTFGRGSQVVTFNVTSESSIGTRADGSHISDGSKANTLFFQVYEVNDNGEIKDDQKDPYIDMNMDFTEGYVVLRFSVEPDKKYKAAFWAQHTTTGSENKIVTTPFIIDDLRAVKVEYQNAKNNDDLRDAFCAASDVFRANSKTETVILHRPFAQINVGTTGADYKNYAVGNIMPRKTIKYSKIIVNGVKNTLNIFNNKIVEDGNFNGKATFEFNETIAEQTSSSEEYLRVKLNDPKLNKVEWGTVKESNSKLDNGLSRSTLGFFSFKNDYPTMLEASKFSDSKPEGSEKDSWDKLQATYDKNGDEDYTPSPAPEKYYLTEEFKYLSMCYVLVPFETENYPSTENQDKGTADPYNSTTVTSVEVFFGESDNDGRSYFTLTNVPVHRNWRTNILGGLSDTPNEDPNDPTIPDDPSSLFYNVSLYVKLCPIYYGEYYETNGDEGVTGDWVKKEFPSGNDSLHGHN